MRSLSLDYRLAPENPFPAAIQDTLGAYRALLDNGEDPAGLAMAGDSAGGGLSVTSLLAARDEGLPMPAAIVAFSAGLDATCSGESMDSKAGIDPLFTRESLAPAGPGSLSSPMSISITAILPPGFIASRQVLRILMHLSSSQSCRIIFRR
jgi:acetyl esterase/lipase